jgi:hypothetical protein
LAHQFSALAGWVNPCSKVLRTLTSVNTSLTRCELLLTWLLFCQRILQYLLVEQMICEELRWEKDK